jgi:hypothetical protein
MQPSNAGLKRRMRKPAEQNKITRLGTQFRPLQPSIMPNVILLYRSRLETSLSMLIFCKIHAGPLADAPRNGWAICIGKLRDLHRPSKRLRICIPNGEAVSIAYCVRKSQVKGQELDLNIDLPNPNVLTSVASTNQFHFKLLVLYRGLYPLP